MLHDIVAQWHKTALINADTGFYVLTRFNLFWPDRYPDEASFQAWSERRLALFRQFCVPGVRSQTLAPQAWYVMFDESYRARGAELRDLVGLDIFRPVFLPRAVPFGQTPAWFAEHVLRHDLRAYGLVAGIRLDSDDTLSRHFIAFLDDCLANARSVREPPLALNFPYQLRIGPDRRVYVYVATDSAHTAPWERLETAKTPYCASHPLLWQKIAMVECGTRFPMVAVHGHDNNIGIFPWHDLIAIENGEQVAAKFFDTEFPPD